MIYKDGDQDDIRNWHPITLLNIHNKILAKIYADRLKLVLPCIIDDDQHAFLKGRQITEAVQLTQDIIEISEHEMQSGAIIFLDQQKAYALVEWLFLKLCMKILGFRERFSNIEIP